MKKETKTWIGVILFIVGIVTGFYVGGWLMFVKPIMDCCYAFDAGILKVSNVGMAIIKCVFATPIGVVIFWIFSIIAALIGESD